MGSMTNSTVRTVLNAVVVMATVALIVIAITTVSEQGLVDSFSQIITAYLAAVLLYFLLKDRLHHPAFYVAFFAGVVVWSLEGYVSGDGEWWLLIVFAVALFIVLTKLRPLLTNTTHYS